MSTSFPVSDHVKTRGIVYFARMLSKIRLHAAGQLPADSYEHVKARALLPGTADEVFDDLFAGRPPLNTEHVFAWNLFLLKRGWRDSASQGIAAGKAASGFAHRDDIQTWADLHDAEEGRTPQLIFD